MQVALSARIAGTTHQERQTMRDNSPAREPSIDANRPPRIEIWDDTRCDACGTRDRLGIVGDWILCAECERKHREAEE